MSKSKVDALIEHSETYERGAAASGGRPVRPGPKMLAARDYIAEHPGCCILPVAEAVGPNGSRQYGYAIVHRAIKAGLINVVGRGPHNSYRLEAAQ